MARIADSFYPPLEKKCRGYQHKNLMQNGGDLLIRMKLTLGVMLLAAQALG